MTPQTKMAKTLGKSGIPAKEIKCYGQQIMITAWSLEAANKWATLLANFAKVRKPHKARDYNQKHTSGRLTPDTHTVWRVWATI